MLLFFGVSLVPLQGGLTVANVVAQPAFLASSAASFAALIGVTPAQLYAVNVSDLATGAFVAVGSIRRQLAGAGSKGVLVTYVVRLGKTPQESRVANMSAVLASPALAGSTLRAVTLQLGAATQLGAAAFSVSLPPSGIALANSPFVLGGTVVVAAAAADSGGSSVSGTVGGIVAAIALACAIWGARSYAKHGVCPCCRDRAREKRAILSSTFEVNNALAEAEAAVGADAASLVPGSGGSGSGGGGGANKKALAVRRLVEKARAADAATAELAEIKKQLAAAKKGGEAADADEVAQLRAQLREAKAQAAALAAGAAPAGRQAQAFAPQSTS